MKTINLRVYRRTQNDITLLWNTKDLTDEEKINVEIREKESKKPMTFVLSATLEGLDKVSDVVGAMIDHEKNGLDKDKDYVFEVILNKKDVYPIKVLPFGVLPYSEKDKKSSNVHLFGWYEEGKEWVKVPIVKTKKGWAIPVVHIKDN